MRHRLELTFDSTAAQAKPTPRQAIGGRFAVASRVEDSQATAVERVGV